MGYFDDMTDKMINEQENKKDALGLDATVSKKKEHLHVTIKKDSIDKLKIKAQEQGLSMGVLLQLLIDEHL